jgi:ribosome-binding protein aMBF1 (putative translation factor)
MRLLKSGLGRQLKDERVPVQRINRVRNSSAAALTRHGDGDGDLPDRSVDWYVAKFISAAYLRRCRESKGWSQRQMAKALGVTAGYIGKMESTSSERHASLDLLLAAARVSGIPFVLRASKAELRGLIKE